MDIATLGGVFGGIIVVVIVMILDGGSPAELFAAPSAILLTVGGAIAAATTASSLKTVLNLPTLLMKAFMGAHKDEGPEAVENLVRMADKARREGLLALEEDSKKIHDDFLRRGVMLVVDGVDPAQVRAILEIDVKNMQERHGAGIGLLNAMGGFAPTMGIIGTVMGLIGVLKNLSDPGSLGESIATAFLATLWGIATANLLWIPLAGKLSHNSEEEVKYRHLLIEGILSLQAGENPRVLREKLMGFLPPKSRVPEGGKAAKPAGAKA